MVCAYIDETAAAATKMIANNENAEKKIKIEETK